MVVEMATRSMDRNFHTQWSDREEDPRRENHRERIWKLVAAGPGGNGPHESITIRCDDPGTTHARGEELLTFHEACDRGLRLLGITQMVGHIHWWREKVARDKRVRTVKLVWNR